MVYKGCTSNAAAELLRKETNVHFVNPCTNKIDLKMFTKHLCEKDEHANDELDNYFLDCSSFSDDQLINDIESSSSDTSDEKCVNTFSKSKKKRRVNLLAFSTEDALKINSIVFLGSCCASRILALRTQTG